MSRGARTSQPPTTAASAALPRGTNRRRIPRARAQAAIGSTPRTGRTRAVERQLADEQRVRERVRARPCSAAHSMPTAIGRSNAAPSLRRSAGARLTVIRRGGSLKPLFSSAPRMRTRPSLHARVGQPDDVAAGQPDRDVDLDVDRRGLDADHGCGRDTREHVGSTLRTRCQRAPAFRAAHGAPPRPVPGRPSSEWSRRRLLARLAIERGADNR